MANTIVLQRDVMKALSRFMAKNDIRYYLNGLLVEIHRNVAYLVATDGHRLAVARVDVEAGKLEAGPWEPCSIILPRESVLQAIKMASKTCGIPLTIEGNNFEFSWAGAKFGGEAVDGKFPDWRRVIPREVSGELAQFNPDYISDASEAAKDLGRKYSPAIGHNGDKSALIVLREDVLAVIMPMLKDAPTEAPEWVGEDSENVGRVLDVEEAHGEAIAEDKVRSLPAGESAELVPANDSEPVAIAA